MAMCSGRRISAVASVRDWLRQPVADLHVGVAEEDQPPVGRLHRAQHVGVVEDVHVFVERRAVADFEQLIDDQRARRQLRQPVAVVVAQRFVGPADGGPGHGVEGVGGLESGAHLVVIAADDGVRLQAADAIDDGVRVGAVAHQVAEHQDALVGNLAGGVEHGLERLEIRVDVTQDQVAHQCSNQSVT